MAMDWLKGLVGPMAQFSPTGQPMQGPPGAAPYPQQGYGPPMGGPPVGGPPVGGAPPPAAAPGTWGAPLAWDPNAPAPGGAQPTYGAGMPGVDPNAFAPAYGTPAYGAPGQAPSYGAPGQAPSYGAPGQAPSYGAPPPGAPAAPGADPRVAQLENRCEELRRDLESLALFAQTLLAVLEDKKVMSQQDFQEMRRKLDLLDGKLDDRIGKAT
jgi:hypothetical protein